jgi:hypothetical protein
VFFIGSGNIENIERGTLIGLCKQWSQLDMIYFGIYLLLLSFDKFREARPQPLYYATALPMTAKYR